MKIEILSTKLIKPSIPTPLHLRKYNLSFIDQLAVPYYFGFLFFFISDVSKKAKKYNDELEKSLSKALARFYPLAGRFNEDGFSVECDDQGVEVSRARVVGGHLTEIVHGRPETELLETFLPDKISLGQSAPRPIMAVQINMFECGGIGVGIQIAHDIGDGFSVTTFMNQWANTNRIRNGVVLETLPPPNLESASRVFTPRKLVGLKPKPPGFQQPDNLVTKCFRFDGPTISALKEKPTAPTPAPAPYYSDYNNKKSPSKVQIVTAQIWKMKIGIAGAKHGQFRPCMLFFPMNLRGEKTRLDLPNNSFGTVNGPVITWFKPPDHVTKDEEEEEVELHELVSLVRNTIKETGVFFSNVSNPDDIYWKLVNFYNELGEDKPIGADLCLSTSWCGFDYYGIDFGWGVPTWVATVFKDEEFVFLMDTKCGDGIEAWVTLTQQDMIEFERYYQHVSNSNPSTVKICSKL